MLTVTRCALCSTVFLSNPEGCLRCGDTELDDITHLIAKYLDEIKQTERTNPFDAPRMLAHDYNIPPPIARKIVVHWMKGELS